MNILWERDVAKLASTGGARRATGMVGFVRAVVGGLASSPDRG